MAHRRSAQPSALRRTIYSMGQSLFAVALLLIFVLTFLVQGGSIKLPQWAKSWDQGSPEEQAEQAGAMIACVLVLFFLFFGFGLHQLAKESRTV